MPMSKDKNQGLRNKDLQEILKQFPDDMPLVVTRVGKGHQYAITREDIEVTTSAYFGNCNVGKEFFHDTNEDDISDEELTRRENANETMKFLNIGNA
jgi:hypothetical protein